MKPPKSSSIFRDTCFFLFSVVLHVLVVLSLLKMDSSSKSGTIAIQVKYLNEGASKAQSMPVPTRRKITTGFAKEPQAPDNQVTNSSSVEASGDSREGFTVLGKDLGIVAIYPRMSRVLGESGKVLVEVTQGDLHFLPRVVLSSGFPRLDESALSATQSAIGSGLLSAYLKDRNSIQVSFIFRLVKNKDEIKGE